MPMDEIQAVQIQFSPSHSYFTFPQVNSVDEMEAVQISRHQWMRCRLCISARPLFRLDQSFRR